MGKCYSYHYEFGKGRCYGTKEIEYCSCEGDEARCNFYPGKRKEAGGRGKITDIFTLLHNIQETGYEITFRPDECYAGTVIIKLTDPKTANHIAIRMHVNQKYINDFNSAIFDHVNAMIEAMDKHRKEVSDL